MSGLTWEMILSATGGRWLVEPTESQSPPVGASIDSRELRWGQIFVAYVGQRTDGHSYIKQASDAGAGLCIVTDQSAMPFNFSTPTLLVEDATTALTEIAMKWRPMIKGTVVGVTGSNGKTTTTRLIHAVLSQMGESWSSSKSHNNAIGVPMSVLNAPADAKSVIFELGTSSPGEIGQRAKLVRPDISVIASIGRAHLEELGSIEGVCREKASIFKHTKTLGIVPGGIPALDDAIAQIDPDCRIQHLNPERLRDVEMDERSVSFEFGGHRFTASVPGKHNALNAALAVLVGRECKLSDQAIATGLSKAKLPEMRLDRVEIPTKHEPIVIYNDAYNANPDSTRAAIEFFTSLKSDAHKVAILGDMRELGESTESEHSSMVAELSAKHMDSIGRVVLVGPHYSRATAGTMETSAAIDDHAMSELARTINPGDLVLLKGSRGIGLERLVYILINRYTANAGRRRTDGLKKDSDS